MTELIPKIHPSINQSPFYTERRMKDFFMCKKMVSSRACVHKNVMRVHLWQVIRKWFKQCRCIVLSFLSWVKKKERFFWLAGTAMRPPEKVKTCRGDHYTVTEVLCKIGMFMVWILIDFFYRSASHDPKHRFHLEEWNTVAADMPLSMSLCLFLSVFLWLSVGRFIFVFVLSLSVCLLLSFHRSG